MIDSIVKIFPKSGHEVAILGETAKWVPISPQRVQTISVGTNSINIDLVGVANEKVAFSFTVDSNLQTASCTIPTSKSARVTLNLSSSSPQVSCA